MRWRNVCWFLASLIGIGYALCALAVYLYLSSTEPTRGEYLMVLPGVSITLIWIGVLTSVCIYAAHEVLRPWETGVLYLVAILAFVLFPLILAIEDTLLRN